MKRLLSILLALALLLSLAACGEAEEPPREVDTARSFAKFSAMVHAPENFSIKTVQTGGTMIY